MRVCIEVSTGKLIEAQSNATEKTLITNALNNGYLIDEILEKIVTEEEFQIILDSLPKPQQGTTIDEYLLDLDFRLSSIELGL